MEEQRIAIRPKSRQGHWEHQITLSWTEGSTYKSGVAFMVSRTDLAKCFREGQIFVWMGSNCDIGELNAKVTNRICHPSCTTTTEPILTTTPLPYQL